MDGCRQGGVHSIWEGSLPLGHKAPIAKAFLTLLGYAGEDPQFGRQESTSGSSYLHVGSTQVPACMSTKTACKLPTMFTYTFQAAPLSVRTHVSLCAAVSSLPHYVYISSVYHACVYMHI